MNTDMLIGLEVVLIGVGMIGWIVALVRGRVHHWMAAPDRLDAWPISGSDFFLFVLLVVTFFTVGPLGAAKLLGQDLTDLSSRDLMIQGFATQVSLLAAWALFRVHPAGVPPTGIGHPGAAALTGLKTFVFLMPPLLAVVGAWYWILDQSGADPVPQDMVELIRDASGAELVLWAVLAVGLAPVAEELVFRAGLFRFLAAKMPALGAAFLSGLLFSLAHFNLLTLIPLLVLGMVLSVLFMKTGRLTSSIALHAAFNLNSMLVILLTPGG